MFSPKNNFYAGKTSLVTGATSGIGREIAKQLVFYGCRVLAGGRDKQEMDSLLKELNEISSGCAQGFVFDLSDKNSRQELIKRISENHEVDILVNNAGFGYMADFYEMPENLIDSMAEVNMAAIVDLCRQFLPKMVERRDGGILNVGSVASFFGTPGSALYGATKHFVLGFTDALHQEMLRYGVHVTGIYPGHTDSHFISRATAGKKEKWHKAMSPISVAKSALKGLSKNKMRVVPGLGNKMRVLAASFLPVSMILKKIYNKNAK